MRDFWPQAQKAGISRSVYERALKGFTPDPDIIRLAESQPEFVTPIWDYINKRVSAKRIANGRKMRKKYPTTLRNIETKYGVSKYVILAIWGMETTYGSFNGRKSVVRSLATLASQGTRQKFGRAQLIEALKIIQAGEIPARQLIGSWAGAMGHTQFIPSTYNAYAVDFNGDNKRDVWNSVADGLASAANYLKASGWIEGQTWGYEVVLPKGFDYALSGQKKVHPISYWQKHGVKRVGGRHFPRPNDPSALILPAGANGPAFLILTNFRAILRYNRSIAYALAVGHLADRIRGFDSFIQSWPLEDLPLAHKDRIELQTYLQAKGFLKGKIDGIIGAQTRAALRSWQRQQNLPADGYPSIKVLQHMRQNG